MQVRSAKAKGMRLQRDIAKKIVDAFGLTEDDVRSIPGSVPGPDIWLSKEAIEKFPFDVEAKNVESLNVWKALEQLDKRKSKKLNSLLVFHRNNTDTYCCLTFDLFLTILKESNTLKDIIFDRKDLEKQDTEGGEVENISVQLP